MTLLKMKVLSFILTVSLCFDLSVQVVDSADRTGDGQNHGNQSMNTPSYSFDPQVAGFNSTDLISGPIVLADKRTLFIPDLRYSGVEIDFWAGIGSPYGSEKQLVQTDFIDGPTNLYVLLPENLTLDTVDFFQAMSKNTSLDYVIFEKVNRTAIKDYNELNRESTIFRIPKCCLHNQYLNISIRVCSEAIWDVDLEVQVFESNETGLDPEVMLDSSDYRVIPYYQWLQCGPKQKRVRVDELHGFIYNSSLIIEGYGILSHGQYCVDVFAYSNSSIVTSSLYCVNQITEPSDPDVYLPVLIISAICFLLSAVAYGVILKAKDIQKRCFIGYASTMCLSFICLIVMQVQSNTTTCTIFGFWFLFTAPLSYFWLLILCVELLYLVMYPKEDTRYARRWQWYCGISLGLSFIIFLISLFSGEKWIPDVPSSFIMGYGSTRCKFNTSVGRAYITFVPLLVSILGSVISLVAFHFYVNKNENDRIIRNHVDWLLHYNGYKFMSRTFIMIIIVTCLWIINIIFYTSELGSPKTQLGLDVIKASLGIIVLISFVGNKYTRAEIMQIFTQKNEAITEVGLGLNGIPTPETPIEVDPLITREQTHFTTFANNRINR